MKPVLSLAEIKSLLDAPRLLGAIEEGFVALSAGRARVPPVGFLHLDAPPGDVHIKYGYIEGDPYYVLKVASAFYENPLQGLSPADGLILVFSSRTGGVELVLLDEGWLTDMRTAAAGAVAARHLANPRVDCIGIVGTGVQARLQLELLKGIVECQRCLVWGRDREKADRMVRELAASEGMRAWGLELAIADSLDELVAQSRLIVTTTSSTEPLIAADAVQAGTHITAMGSDDYGKQELPPELLQRADLVVADSRAQCVDHGECRAAVEAGMLSNEDILELGSVISQPESGRAGAEQITIADLTGVAVQDIQIARMIAEAYNEKRG